MSKYPEYLKKQVVAEYIKGDKPTSEILAVYSIPKSNLFRWLKKYEPPKDIESFNEYNPRNFYLRGIKIERLETIISILKRVHCTVDSPLSDRLLELERLYGEYHVHTLCDALEVSRGTFYNHIKRNKRCRSRTSGKTAREREDCRYRPPRYRRTLFLNSIV